MSGAENRYFRSFILFQRFRTAAVRQDLSKAGELLAEEITENTDVDADEIRDWTNGFQRSMKRMMLHSLLNPGLISNLKILLLIDTTGKNFITSEIPVLFDNPAGSTLVAGVANAGLQIFCPISPTHCVLFIDPSCYDVSKSTSRPISIKNQGVITEINSFHARHHPEKIFYQETGRESDLNRYLESTDGKSGLETSTENKDNNEKVMLSLNQRSPRPSPKIPFISPTRHPQNKESRFGKMSSKVIDRCIERINTVLDYHGNDINKALIDSIAQITQKDPSRDNPASWEPR